MGNTAAFLVSPLASAITGSVIYVDNGLNNMALVRFCAISNHVAHLLVTTNGLYEIIISASATSTIWP